MLFNKNNNGIDELQKLTGFLYAYNHFENIRTDIEPAHEDMGRLIGSGVMQIAEDHYLSEQYESPGQENELLTNLVKHVQLPIAYYSIYTFSKNTDVSHEDTGRKVKIDAEREKLPWEWMLEKDERAIINKAHRTTDRLLTFLDNNADNLTEWKDSEARKAILVQFFQNAEQFNSVYPISHSRRFFLHIQPFIAEVERKFIAPILGKRYSEIKEAMKAGTYDDKEKLLPLIRVPLALLSIAVAVDRLAIEVLPEGVFQRYISSTVTQNAKKAAEIEQKREFAIQLNRDGQTELQFLQQALIKINAAGDDYSLPNLTQGVNEKNSFARV